MPASVECPSCDTRLSVPPTAAGKRVRCPNCQQPVAVPAADDFEVVEDDPPVKAARPSKRRPVDDEDDRPQAKKGRRDDDDVDDRPVRRKKSRKGGSGGQTKLLVFGGVGLAAAVLVCVGIFVIARKVGGPGGVPGVPAGPVAGLVGPPPNFSIAKDAAGGFSVYLPGQAGKSTVTVNGQSGEVVGSYTWHASLELEKGPMGRRLESSVSSNRLKNGYNPGTTPDQLYETLRTYEPSFRESDDQEVVGRKPVTLGGRPALEVRVRSREQFRGVMHWVYYVTHDGQKVYVIEVESQRGFADDDTLKTITDSFTLI